jgi:hypothetical protein
MCTPERTFIVSDKRSRRAGLVLAAAQPLAINGNMTKTIIRRHQNPERLGQIISRNRLENIVIGRMARGSSAFWGNSERL